MATKFDQRVYIEEVRGHDIVLSIGDNLSDYAEIYGRTRTTAEGKKTHLLPHERVEAARQDTAQWGTDFILLPNPVYGGFLQSVHECGIVGAGEKPTDPTRVTDQPRFTADVPGTQRPLIPVWKRT